LFAAVETHERPTLLRLVVANTALEHRIARLDRVEHGSLRHRPRHVHRDLARQPRQRAQVDGQDDADHGRDCTSTDRTAGRSRTIGDQVSPESADAYTCPPVVPKYTPQGPSESTRMASRRTLT